jgi:hypothetical protein
VLVRGWEVVEVVVRELEWFDETDVDPIFTERVVDVADVLRSKARRSVIRKHEGRRRRPAVFDIVDAASAVIGRG